MFLYATDELDSYMYQTVGHQAIDLYSEAMDLPLYRRTIQGSSLDISRNYSVTEGDEVEDLYELLKLVKVGLSVLNIKEKQNMYYHKVDTACQLNQDLWPKS